jgi:hypothetical protein
MTCPYCSLVLKSAYILPFRFAEEMEDLMEKVMKLAAEELGDARVRELLESMVKVTKIDGYVIAPNIVDTMLGHVFVGPKIANTTKNRETMNLEVVRSCGKYSYVATSAAASEFIVVPSKRRVGGGRDFKSHA